MERIGTLILTVILFMLGIVIVFLNPLNATAISFGMFLVSVAVLSVAVQVYFPPTRQNTVRLKLVRRVKPKSRRKPKKRVKKTRKRKRPRRRR